MIFNFTQYGGGGGAMPYGFLLVDYPSGATLTCTNIVGQKAISSTEMLFYVRGAGDCTATITNGSRTYSKTVTFDSEGQSMSMELTFGLAIVVAGLVQSGYSYTTVGKRKQSSDTAYAATAPTVTTNPLTAKFSGTTAKMGIVYFAVTGCRDLSTIKGTGTFNNTTQAYDGFVRAMAWSSIGTYAMQNVVTEYQFSHSAIETEFELDISGSTADTLYIGFYLQQGNTRQTPVVTVQSLTVE